MVLRKILSNVFTTYRALLRNPFSLNMIYRQLVYLWLQQIYFTILLNLADTFSYISIATHTLLVNFQLLSPHLYLTTTQNSSDQRIGNPFYKQP